MLRSSNKGRFNRLNKLWVLIVFAVISARCNTNTKSYVSDDVTNVIISYLPKGINTNMAIRECNDIFFYHPVLRDTSISDKGFIDSLSSIINRLKPSYQEVNYEFRIKMVFNFLDKKQLEVCLGEGYLINVDGVLMEDSKDLFDLIDKTIYTKVDTPMFYY
jgi:hypothetical protein